MFQICLNKGFHITFANGWTASVQWGAANYSSNYSLPLSDRGSPVPASSTAEVARWKGDDPLEDLDIGDTVKGYLTADEVLYCLNETAAKKA